MIYDIRLTISHHYARPAGNGRHLLRVVPKAMYDRQHVTASYLEAYPQPDHQQDRTDFFGNPVTTITQIEPHTDMKINMVARVEITPQQLLLEAPIGLPQLYQELAQIRDIQGSSPLHFLGPSPRLSPNSEIAHFARSCLDPNQTIATTVRQIGLALNQMMTFDATATTVDTSPIDAFRQRRGVCQDMTHIMILALQSLGIPAGYVSGFLRTLPPEGVPRLEGADAMHAWVRAWCGDSQGWIEYDPTNATVVGSDHIVVAYGRDYSDVSPVIGHLRSSGNQVNSQSVDVVSVE